jgi:undecaprenol kinase
MSRAIASCGGKTRRCPHLSIGRPLGYDRRRTMSIPDPERRPRHISVRIIRSFYFACVGISYLLRTQRNARIEVVLGSFACGIGAWVHIDRVQWAIIAFTIALVLILEGLNTAIEMAIDLASPDIHPLAKHAKDLAAGMVLIASIASVAVGLLILGPPLWHQILGQ